jgi:hypothetical protein
MIIGDLFLLALAAGGWPLAAWCWARELHWRRGYERALRQFEMLLTLPDPLARQWAEDEIRARAPAPEKSEPHVRAAKTRAERRLAKLRAHRQQLEADVHARDLWPTQEP